MPVTPPSSPTPEKVRFVTGLKQVLLLTAPPPKLDEVDEDTVDGLDLFDGSEEDSTPVETKWTRLATQLAGELDTLRGFDDAALDRVVEEAEADLEEEPDSEDKLKALQEAREDRRVKVNAARKAYRDLIARLEKALEGATDSGTRRDQRALSDVLGTATGDHSALRARRRQAKLDGIEARKKKMLESGFSGTILAAPRSKMLVENPGTPGEFHEIDMSEYGPTLAHKHGELYLFEDGWVRKSTRDPGSLTVVEESEDEDGVKIYKVNVMKKSEFLAAAKMGAIEELFDGHGGGYTEVVDSGTVKKGTGDETITEPRLVYRVGRHAPGLTTDQLKDRLRKGRIAHDAAWAAQGRGTSKFISHEAYVEAYDKSVKVLADAITNGTLPDDGTNYYSSYKVSVRHSASIGEAFTRTLSNSVTSSLPSAGPDEFGNTGPSSRKQIPDTGIASVPDTTLVWSMANFNLSSTGDWVLAQFWPQDSSAGGMSVAGGDVKGSHFQSNKGPLLSDGVGSGPESSSDIVKGESLSWED